MDDKILKEILDKVNSYEDNMSSWINDASIYSDLYTIKKQNKKSNRYSNPRLPEMHRAVEALSTTIYRMLTADDPFFSLMVMDKDISQDSLYKTQKMLEMQLKYSRYKQNLLKALRSCIVFGNVFVEENYELVSVNPFGRKVPITTFVPRSITQIGFDLANTDINKSSFIYTTDVVSKNSIMSMYNNEFDEAKKFWNKTALDNVQKDYSGSTYDFIKDRLSRNNYNIDEKNAVELIIYYGKLDCLNDNIEYIVYITNREDVIKFLPNPDQSGNKKYRYAKWIDWDIEPLGYGLGRLLKSQHLSLDSNRQRVTDLLAFGSYNVWLMSSMAGINSNDLVITPNKVVVADDINGLRPLETNMQAAMPGLKLEEILKSDFRAASGATDTLQAAVTEATASEVAIVQNEAMRRISVYAELLSETLVREHLEKMHNNNRMYIRENYILPYDENNQNKNIVSPVDLNIDVDFEVKIVTDKNFKPKRLDQLLKTIELLTSIRTQGIDKYRIDPIPVYKEILMMLDMNPDKLIRSMEEAELLMKVSNSMNPNSLLQKQSLEEENIQNTPIAEVQTPIGKVAGSNVQNNPIAEVQTPIGKVAGSNVQKIPMPINEEEINV